MRLGTNSPDDFLKLLKEKNDVIQKTFLDQIRDLTKTAAVKGMLGDCTVADQKSFDPMLTQRFFQKIVDNLREWNSEELSISNNEDLRRIFVKFNVEEGNYLLSGHVSIQFHVLLFYKPDNRVLECQRELSEIIEKTKNIETKLADDSDQLILDKLKELGYDAPDHKELFQIFYENDELREKIFKDIEGSSDKDIQNLLKRKKELFNELDSLLMEVYHISPVLIDDARLVTGEEGCLFTFDLEHVKNGVKEGLIDPKRIPENIKEILIKRLDEIIKIMNL